MPDNYLSTYPKQQASSLPTVKDYVSRMQAQVPQRMAPRQKTAMDYMLTAPANLLQMLGLMQQPYDVAATDSRLSDQAESMRYRNQLLRERLNSFDERRMTPSATQPRTL